METNTRDKKERTYPRTAICQNVTRKEEELLSTKFDIGVRECCGKFSEGFWSSASGFAGNNALMRHIQNVKF